MNPERTVKPRLLVVELWGLGDLILATPFLRAAGQRFDVTLLAKSHAAQLRPHFWPEVTVVPFTAPWTAFRKKYQLQHWPWRVMAQLRRHLAEENFAVSVSARRDPRDHALMFCIGATERIGFPRLGSQRLLTRALSHPAPESHRHEHWVTAAREIGLQLPEHDPLGPVRRKDTKRILLHTGAGQPIRTWPLERYKSVAGRLRALGFEVVVACDPGQRSWWQQAGEPDVRVPSSVDLLITLLDDCAYFVGNDSGPGHVAAACGVPTFSIFGPQLSEWFTPLSSAAVSIDGKACPFRPCSDYCRFPVAHCLDRITEEEVWQKLTKFVGA
ncbi:MAG: hypothetical protein RLY20_1992 [Verrucomicrobiota bacterium]|jgi:heptosyltransferase-2